MDIVLPATFFDQSNSESYTFSYENDDDERHGKAYCPKDSNNEPKDAYEVSVEALYIQVNSENRN